MAILEKIRSKGVLLMIIVGLALLAFIVGDAITHGSSIFNKSRENVGEINGENVNIKEFQASLDQMTEVYKIETGQTELSEEIISQLRASTWETMVNEKLLLSETEKLGLTVSAEELSDNLIGNNIHPLILQRRAFIDETGRFNRNALIQFIASLDREPENDEMRQQIAQAKNYWKFWEKNVKMTILQEKYNALLSKTITANTLEAKHNYEGAKVNFDVKYVVQPYYTIPDSKFTVSDSEIKDRYNKQKEKYQQEENRSVRYVVFQVKPLKEDYAEAQAWIAKYGAEFKTTTDVAGLVNEQSDIMYDGRNYSETTVPAHLKAFAFGGSTGAIYGPVFANDTYTMAKIMESGIMQSDSAQLRHIFLSADNASKSDSIIAAIKEGASFAELAAKYSAAQQTAKNGGEIGWISSETKGLGNEITNNAFSKAANEIFVVKDMQGTQIFQIMAKTAPRRKVKLAILERKVIASQQSQGVIFNNAKQFAAELKASDFDKRANAKQAQVRTAAQLTKSSDRIADIPQSRQIIRWVYENEEGAVSDVFECGEQFVVATVSEVNEKGYQSLDKVSTQIKAEIIRDKKAEMIIADLSKKTSQYSTIEALAGAIKSPVSGAPAINFNSYSFGGAGFEPAVIGKVSTLTPNKLSAPIKGNAGVYIVVATNVQKTAMPYDAKMMILQQNARLSYTLPYMIIQDIRKNADIEDNRLNFF